MEDTIGNWWRPNFEPPQVSRLLSEMYIRELSNGWIDGLNFTVFSTAVQSYHDSWCLEMKWGAMISSL